MISLYQMQRVTLVGFLAPVLFIVGAVLLLGFVDENPARTAEMTRGTFGPTAWPSYMLYAVIFFAAGWLLQDVLGAFRKARASRRAAADKNTEEASLPRAGEVFELRVLIAIGVIAAYGYLIPVIGFAFATLLFFLVWFVLGGIRRPKLIGLVSVGGTLFMLYLFVKLASMPLARGQGVFAEWTVALYQFLKVF